MSKITLYESAESPSTPIEGQVVLFAKEGTLRSIDSEGNESELGGDGPPAEYRWSVWIPFGGQNGPIQIPVSDSNAASIVGLRPYVSFNEEEDNRVYAVWIDGVVSPLTFTIDAGETGSQAGGNVPSLVPVPVSEASYVQFAPQEGLETNYFIEGYVSITFSNVEVAQ